MTVTLDHGVYVTSLDVSDIFADTTYQRVLDVGRARIMAKTWDRRLAGILEVSDRGDAHTPRYAIIDGQHRWAAAKNLKPPPMLVANVHEGLTPADEAALFDKLNRQRKQPTTWDHWRARKAAGNPTVLAIEATARKHKLVVHEQSSTNGHVTCVSTLEKIANSSGGIDLLDATLNLLHAAWDDQRDAYEAPVVMGLALVVEHFNERLNAQTLVNALCETPPRRVRFQVTALKDSTPGSLGKLTALVLINFYNKRAAPKKLYFPQRWAGVLPKPKMSAS